MGTLLYLKESVANYADENRVGRKIYQKLERCTYQNEEAFLENLSEVETAYLNRILKKELKYAQDDVRAKQLNAIYQNLI